MMKRGIGFWHEKCPASSFSASHTALMMVKNFAGRRVLLSLALVISFSLAAKADEIIYDGALENGWANWSWASVNLANPSPVYGGSDSISVTATNWSALYLDVAATDTSPFTNLTFWINGGATGGQQVQVQAILGSTAQPPVQIGPLPTNSWQQISLSMTALGVANQPDFTGFWIQIETTSAVPVFYVDDISLIAGAITPGTNAPVPVTVDAQANRNAISPLIYGVAFASSNQLSDLNFTMNRSGGNSETRYNWQLNAHNLAADWYFESYPDDTGTNPGATADAFVANSKDGGAQPMITIPMIGWSPMLGPNRSILYSYSVATYGPQTSTDPYLADAGNGISVTNDTPITWNNPDDANFPTTTSFQQGYVRHMMGNWGSSTNGGVLYYIMDNEHSIWFSTHQDVHPVGPTMQEIWTKMLASASMVKSNDPNALVLGPEEWGWSGYFYSGYDQQWSGQNNNYNPADYPDRTANGGWDYIPWLLNQFYQYSVTNHQRLLDYLTVHCYPQEGDVSGDDVSPATALLRNQSTRVFWDTNYVDPSWIDNVIMLIPRLQNWVSTYYPGTKTGVTEYNWGAEANINGATAQADILGIFGREGLDLATRWTTPASNTPTYLSMKMYRNYDGNKSTFGDTSILTMVPDPDDLSAFGAVRTGDGALTLMVINKNLTNATPINVNVTNFNAAGTAQRWQLTSADVINQLANITITNGVLDDTVPAQSITLYILPVASVFNLQIGVNSAPGQFDIWLNGQAGQAYALQSSTDLVHWSAVGTNTLSSNSFEFVMPATNATRIFYRGALNNH
jgi:glycosyl hydrolase family 44